MTISVKLGAVICELEPFRFFCFSIFSLSADREIASRPVVPCDVGEEIYFPILDFLLTNVPKWWGFSKVSVNPHCEIEPDF